VNAVINSTDTAAPKMSRLPCVSTGTGAAIMAIAGRSRMSKVRSGALTPDIMVEGYP